MPKLRTKIQNSKMFGLAAKCGVSHDDLREYAAEVSGGRTEHTSELYVGEADFIIERLETVVSPKKQWSPRTIQYQRQKAGVKTIVSPEQKGKIEKLLRQRHIDADGYKSLCLRMLNHAEPHTTKEASAIIEALKAMNARDRVFGAFKKAEAA